MVRRNRFLAIKQLAVQRYKSIPASVEGEVPAKTQQAVADWLVGGGEPQQPYLGMEDSRGLRWCDRIHRILEVSEEELLVPRHSDLAGLAKHREVVGVSPDGLEPRHPIGRQLAIGLTQLEERKGEGGQQQSDQVKGERRGKSVVDLVARRRAQRIEEELPVVWIEHRAQAPKPRWMSATIVWTVRHL